MAVLAAGFLTTRPAQAQQTSPTTLSDDSVRVMSGLVESSVRQLRAIYFEPNDTRAAQLVDAALIQIPALNQRLSRYTTSLPREQQQQLAQRLRQQPWQVELNTLLRSPQYKGFDARAAKNPELQVAAERLHASGFMGTARPVAAKAPAPTGTISMVPIGKGPAATTKALVAPATRPATSLARTPSKTAATAARSHTVQKGETLFSISRQYQVTPAQLREWNSKDDGGVKIGEVLVVEAAVSGR